MKTSASTSPGSSRVSRRSSFGQSRSLITTIDAMKMVLEIKKVQRRKHEGQDVRLWPFTRSTGSRYVSEVMKAAGISGLHASAKALRYGFGVRLAQKAHNPRLVQKLFGHRSLKTTAIYMDLVGEEERAEVMAVWLYPSGG